MASKLSNEVEAAIKAAGYKPLHAHQPNYVMSFRSPTGIAFAIGRTAAQRLRFWILDNPTWKNRLEAKGFQCTKSVHMASGAKGTGSSRNSNVDAVPGFRRAPLLWFHVKSADEAVAAAEMLY